MIAAVKVISIAFDLDRKKIRQFPNFVEFWGYILCPGNVIMGPWCAYNDYLYLFHPANFVSWNNKPEREIRIFCDIYFPYFSFAVFCMDIPSPFEWIHCHNFLACVELLHWCLRAYVTIQVSLYWTKRSVELYFDSFVSLFAIVSTAGVQRTRVPYHFDVVIILCASYHTAQCFCRVSDRFEIKSIAKCLGIR